ncbi:leucine-rich repeat-containing protein 15 [Teleopsis dalmanni]|uniref:leucine-rich repeat-containing protein 15 n=1 Tax=Teleopsis dalmanni TaxID=139649 RepID=UPI0018CE5A54|nr:leucine-rich repeat-containing protein 15 [Teleopsis dalmanni]
MMIQFVIVALLSFNILTNSNAYEDVVEEESNNTLKRITNIDDNCVDAICKDFKFENITEVAFFDLKAEVRIKDESTYDIVARKNDKTLTFVNSTFAHFPLNMFYTFDLEELDLRHCSIESVTWECFVMADKLTILLLSNNKIKTIDRFTFNYASELQFLFLDENNIHTLHSETFKGLTKLKYLDLSKNSLKDLPDNIFQCLPKLFDIKLQNNQLTNISNEMFANNSQLQTIALARNDLSDMDEYAFNSQQDLILLLISHNPKLEAIVLNLRANNLVATNCSLNRVNIYGAIENADFSDNRITELYFTEPEKLETLNLRNNNLEQIASLTRATNLRTLNLSNNPSLGPQTWPEYWIANSLERLDLSNTSLTNLPIDALATQTNLRTLNLSYNNLTAIDPLSFRYLKNLHHLYINANNWNCFNLNMIMNVLILPNGISTTTDDYDPDFPGEYIHGIACMYRADNEIENEVMNSSEGMNSSNEDSKIQKSEQLKASSLTEQKEIEKLRNELKAIVRFYEQKFDTAFAMINDLNARLSEFERLNKTLWQHVTISV